MCFLLFYSCKSDSMVEDYLKYYILSKKLDYKKSDRDKVTEYYKGEDSTVCEVFYSKHKEITEIRNSINGILFGDNLIFVNDTLKSYYFMSNDTNTTFEVQFGNNNMIKHELGTPIVYNELSRDSTKDSILINVIVCKAIFKDLHIKFSTDGNHYEEYDLKQSNDLKFVNNSTIRYVFPIPRKSVDDSDTYICTYRIIEGITIYGEMKKYNDTLCSYLRNEYLK